MIAALRAAGIGSSVHFIPLHLHPYYRDKYGYRAEDFPQALAAFHRIVSLPLYPKMRDEDVDAVIGATRDILEANRR